MNIQDVLVNPFLDFMEQNDPIEFTILKYLCKSIQGEVDLIRNYHERFIEMIILNYEQNYLE